MIPRLIPDVPYGPAPRAGTIANALAMPPRLVVIHDTGNTAPATAEASYAATRTDAQANWTSCHAYIDTSGPLGSCPLDRQAWAAFSYANQHGWHLEMCGMNAGSPGAVPAATIAHTAQLVAQLCDLADIPKVHLSPAQVAAGARGICGHYDITRGLGVGDHDDPGPAFDWTAFITQVEAGADMAAIDDVAGRVAWMDPRVEGMAKLIPPTTGAEKGTDLPFVAAVRRIDAGVAGLTATIAALSAAVHALAAGGTSIDTAAVLAAVAAAGDTESAAVSALHDQVAALHAQLSAAAQAEAAALATPHS